MMLGGIMTRLPKMLHRMRRRLILASFWASVSIVKNSFSCRKTRGTDSTYMVRIK